MDKVGAYPEVLGTRAAQIVSVWMTIEEWVLEGLAGGEVHIAIHGWHCITLDRQDMSYPSSSKYSLLLRLTCVESYNKNTIVNM